MAKTKSVACTIEARFSVLGKLVGGWTSGQITSIEWIVPEVGDDGAKKNRWTITYEG